MQRNISPSLNLKNYRRGFELISEISRAAVNRLASTMLRSFYGRCWQLLVTRPRQLTLSHLVVALLMLATPICASAERDPPFTLPPRAELLKIRSAIIETSKGRLYFELFPEEAPWHVANFKYLADRKFYDGLSFHLLEPGYLIQGGDPKGTGYGGTGYTIPPEFTQRNHRLGTLGMARKPDSHTSIKKQLVNPQRRSNGSQFHIILGDAPHLDGRYTIFGKLVGGDAVLRRLERGDEIKRVTVFIRQGGR
jgi:cyclophilin family peptidyl-prolyl cis-trans isomerase